MSRSQKHRTETIKEVIKQGKTQQRKDSNYRSSRGERLVDNRQGPNCRPSGRILLKTLLIGPPKILDLPTRRCNMRGQTVGSGARGQAIKKERLLDLTT